MSLYLKTTEVPEFLCPTSKVCMSGLFCTKRFLENEGERRGKVGMIRGWTDALCVVQNEKKENCPLLPLKTSLN